MPEHNDKQPAEPNLSFTEGNLFGALFSFHEKTTDLLRQSSLDDDELKLVTGRIETLLEDATAEMKRTKDFSNLAHRLEAAYAQLTRLVDELSDTDRESGSGEQFSARK
jgi:hypothetical protein